MKWYKQSADESLFPDITWDSPQRLEQLSRVLVVGGSAKSIAWALAIYDKMDKGICKQVTVALPDVLKKRLDASHQLLFCPSNQSGSFSSDSQQILQSATQDHDYLIITGNTGNNSQTNQLLYELITKAGCLTVINGDFVDYILKNKLAVNNEGVMIISPGQLQRYLINDQPRAGKSSEMGMEAYAQLLYSIDTYKQFATWQFDHIWVRAGSKISSSRCLDLDGSPMSKIPSFIARVVMLTHKEGAMTFETLTSAAFGV